MQHSGYYLNCRGCCYYSAEDWGLSLAWVQLSPLEYAERSPVQSEDAVTKPVSSSCADFQPWTVDNAVGVASVAGAACAVVVFVVDIDAVSADRLRWTLVLKEASCGTDGLEVPLGCKVSAAASGTDSRLQLEAEKAVGRRETGREDHAEVTERRTVGSMRVDGTLAENDSGSSCAWSPYLSLAYLE